MYNKDGVSSRKKKLFKADACLVNNSEGNENTNVLGLDQIKDIESVGTQEQMVFVCECKW